MFSAERKLGLVLVHALAAVCILAANPLHAAENVAIEPPAEGSVSKSEGLSAWSRIYEVASHPRCANCHVGASGRPMWSGPSFGKERVHGMNIQAGESRMGLEFVPCSTCHTSKASNNSTLHAAPMVAADWRLAPIEADWFGKTTEEICNQLRDPDRNGGRDWLALAEHLDHDVILHWAWNPGGAREAAPYSLQEHVNDILAWGVAGQPCPGDEGE